MAQRPVFFTRQTAPYVNVTMPDFQWNGGFAASQKQKNIDALHRAFQGIFPDKKVLEISSKSRTPLGVALSAFNLKKFVPELGRSVSVECVFQGGKVFSAGGPYTDLYAVTSRQAKGDPRLKNSGMVKGFYFDDKTMPTTPRTAFYNWLYINALLENPKLAEALLEYDAFTDIEFNPDRSVNCQAEAAAVYVSLARQGKLDQCRDFDAFVQLLKP